MTSARPVKLLFLGSQMTTGGAQRVLFSQALWFHEHGWPVTVAFLYDKDGLHADWQRRYPFPVLSLEARRAGSGKLANGLRLPGAILRLYRLLRRERFDAIQTFTHHASLIGIPAAWLAGVPVRLASHHGHIRDFPRSLERLHTWMINARLATRLVAVSEATRRDALAEGIRPGRILTIPNGVDPAPADPTARAAVRAELGLPEDTPLVLTAGRLEAEKGHADLLEAIPAVLAACPRAVFLLAGGGSQRGALEEQAARLNVTGSVRFLGVRGDISRLLRAADVFVQPSRSEGLPMAILEAMSAGMSIVATRAGGVGELVVHGETGLLSEPNDPAGLAQSVVNLLNDSGLRMRLAESAGRKVEAGYTRETMCVQYRDTILEFLPRGA